MKKQKEFYEFGLDLTFCNDADKLQELFHELNLYNVERSEKQYCYKFTQYEEDNTGLEVRTGAHPFANGLLFNIGQGTRGQGYMSYVGVKGNKKEVEKLKRFFKKHCDIKEFSNTPDFI